MILGVGTDVVDIADLRRRMERTPELSGQIFDREEVAYCEAQADPWPHLAARFAAKEAVMKALGTGWAAGIEFSDIVVRRAGGGSPEVELKGPAAERVAREEARLSLSLSHAAGLALAFAVLARR